LVKYPYRPKDYWEDRLSRSMNLEGVGLLGRGIKYNSYLYRSKIRAVEKGLKTIKQGDLRGKSLLDLGSGIGFWVDYFMKQGIASCVGVDITEASIQYLTNRFLGTNTTFVRSDISDPDLPIRLEQQFDIITAIDVLYHVVSDSMLVRTIGNINQLTKPQGWLIFTEVLFSPEGFSNQPHVKWRPRTFWERLLTENGFAIRLQIPVYFFLRKAVSGSRPLRYLVNFIYSQITSRISEKHFWGDIYLSSLGTIDQLCISLFARSTSSYVVFAQKS